MSAKVCPSPRCRDQEFGAKGKYPSQITFQIVLCPERHGMKSSSSRDSFLMRKRDTHGLLASQGRKRPSVLSSHKEKPLSDEA